ncbi:MAG: hypothetical protein WBD87_01220 [Candidatus Acidiferrales bacterium]
MKNISRSSRVGRNDSIPSAIVKLRAIPGQAAKTPKRNAGNFASETLGDCGKVGKQVGDIQEARKELLRSEEVVGILK